jgi:hypothetical protein
MGAKDRGDAGTDSSESSGMRDRHKRNYQKRDKEEVQRGGQK